jgi:hypothetical protein
MAWRIRMVLAPFAFVAASLVVGIPLAYAVLLLGGATGVIAMCATAPEWWYPFYYVIAALPLVVGCAAGAYLTRRVIRGSLK